MQTGAATLTPTKVLYACVGPNLQGSNGTITYDNPTCKKKNCHCVGVDRVCNDGTII